MEEWKKIKEHVIKFNKSGSFCKTCALERFVSNFGRIKSVYHNRIEYSYGTQSKEYKIAEISGIRFRMNILVYKYFVGEIPKGMEIDHIDNDPINNHVSNLQVLTQQENKHKKIFNKKKLGNCLTMKHQKKKYRFHYRINNKAYSQYFFTQAEQLEFQKLYIECIKDGIIS